MEDPQGTEKVFVTMSEQGRRSVLFHKKTALVTSISGFNIALCVPQVSIVVPLSLKSMTMNFVY